LVIWGAKGHALVLADFLTQFGHSIIALFDNDPNAVSPMPGVPVYYGLAGLDAWRKTQSDVSNVRSLVAIGGDRGRDRLELQQRLIDVGVAPLPSAVHPRAFVANNVVLGPGTQVAALAGVCDSCTVGAACIINTKASIDHEGTVGNGVHLAPGATLAGCIKIGDGTMIGTGAVVLPRITIGHDTVIGAGSVVTRDIPDGVIAYGNPARVMRKNERR
jgi:sugar O-acyltransferase (sialic acid O-acetyltransferase NeuD family)